MKKEDYKRARMLSLGSKETIIKELETDSKNDSEIAYEFIRTLFKEFAKESIRFGKNKYNFIMCPHHFRERQLSSVITPILHKLCNGFVMAEIPVSRKGTANIGWTDYWCIFKGYTIVIEIKHSRDILDTEHINLDRTVRRWETMKGQLRNIQQEIKSYEEETKGVIQIGLHFISSYSNQDFDKTRLNSHRDNVKNILVRFGEKLKPDYAGCWLIPEEMAYDCNGFAFPSVLLMGKIYGPITHKGANQI